MESDVHPGRNRVLLGGCWLAFLAAAVNAHFLMRFGLSVSHLTGDLSRLGLQAVTADSVTTREVLLLLTTLLGFVAGAALAGWWIGNPVLTLSRPYGRAVMAIGLALGLAWRLENSWPTNAALLASMSCGFQNSLATRYRGLVLRTTHVTGVLTDIGQLIGMRLGGHSIETWKILGQTAILVAFFAGALSGALLEHNAPGPALLVLALLYLASGLAWFILKRRLTA
jgi:uncharacterized membrane protein YoaK (UPF0700 family)